MKHPPPDDPEPLAAGSDDERPRGEPTSQLPEGAVALGQDPVSAEPIQAGVGDAVPEQGADSPLPELESNPASLPSGEGPRRPRSPSDAGDVVAQLVSSGLVLVGVGWSLASTSYSIFQTEDVVGLLTANRMTPELRRRMLWYMLGGGLALPTVALGYLAFARSKVGVARIASVARILAPLLVAFFVPVFFNWRAFAKHELLLVISLTAFGLLLERLFRVSLGEIARLRAERGEAPVRRVRPRWLGVPLRVLSRVAPKLPFVLTACAATFTAGYFAYYTILNHYRLQTSSWDLAIFDNMMWNLCRGEWFKASPDLGRTGSHIQYHATFVAYLYLPFYAIRQHADTLLALQALLVGAGAIPLYLLAKLRTESSWTAFALSIAYCLHGPLHGPVFYDFHFLTSSPFFIWWVLYFFETGRRKALVVSWLVALSVREDVSACLSMAGLYLLICRQRPWWAFFGGLLSGLYFVAMKFGIMPLHRSAADKETFTWMFKDLVASGSQGYGGVLVTILTNPLYALNATLESEKLSYLLRMFGPVLLLPLRSPKPWIMLLPAAIFTLLSSGYKPLYQTYFQYTSNWTPYLFYGAAVVIAQLGRGEHGPVRRRAAVYALLAACVAFSYHHGSMLQRENFRGGFRKIGFTYTPADQKKYADLMDLAREIPRNASVAATETEAPHVSNREDCFTMRFGHDDADYMLLAIAEARTGNTRKFFKQAVDSGHYGFVRQSGQFMLWKRGAPKDQNAKGLALIGPEPKAPPRRKK